MMITNTLGMTCNRGDDALSEGKAFVRTATARFYTHVRSFWRGGVAAQERGDGMAGIYDTYCSHVCLSLYGKAAVRLQDGKTKHKTGPDDTTQARVQHTLTTASHIKQIYVEYLQRLQVFCDGKARNEVMDGAACPVAQHVPRSLTLPCLAEPSGRCGSRNSHDLSSSSFTAHLKACRGRGNFDMLARLHKKPNRRKQNPAVLFFVSLSGLDGSETRQLPC